MTNQKSHQVWPVIINLSLPPAEWMKSENILAYALIPGPKSPKDFDSFLYPMVTELLILANGIEAFDGYSKTPFTLRVHLILVTGIHSILHFKTLLIVIGDGPGTAEAMGMKKPGNSFSPCRSCHIQGVRNMDKRNSPYYVPHQGNCNPNQLLLRTDLRGDIQTAEIAGEQFKKRLGIVRPSILLHLKSIHFPRSFPIDVMHAILLNNVPLLYRIWSSEIELQGNDHVIPTAELEQIGAAMAKARAHIPMSLSRAPRDIFKHFRSFKAAEWKGWLLYYGCPLLHTHLKAPYLANFRTLSMSPMLRSRILLPHPRSY